MPGSPEELFEEVGGEAVMSGTREAGDRGERAAAEFLEWQGCEILATQWRCRYGELDLVARDQSGTVCFVEVKLRSAGAIGLPREFVDSRKQDRLRRAALAWLGENDLYDAPARFDVAEIYQGRDGVLRVNYLVDAFT